jgi:hypothetical protein
VPTGSSGFQSVDSYGSPLAPVVTPATNSILPATAGYGGPSFLSGGNFPAAAPSSSYGAPSAPALGSSPAIQQPLSVYGSTAGSVVTSAQIPRPPPVGSSSSYGAPFGPVIGDKSFSTPSPGASSSHESGLASGSSHAQQPDAEPSLGGFVGSLDQSSASYDSPVSLGELSTSSPKVQPSLASTFLHVQGDYSGELVN